MDYKPAQFIRFIATQEDAYELLDEVKAETWTRRAEHAILRLIDGRRILVRGGFDGIELCLDANGRVVATVAESICVVAELIWHTHPRATGPSDFDRHVLDILNQESSVVHEINGVPGGTLFFRAGEK